MEGTRHVFGPGPEPAYRLGQSICGVLSTNHPFGSAVQSPKLQGKYDDLGGDRTDLDREPQLAEL